MTCFAGDVFGKWWNVFICDRRNSSDWWFVTGETAVTVGW
jgi:hypothetical protein